MLADPATSPTTELLISLIAVKGPLWDSTAGIFIKFKMDALPTSEHLTERIETVFNRWSELNECKKLLCKADDTADGLRVDLCASQNDIQDLQYKAKTRERGARGIAQGPHPNGG